MPDCKLQHLPSSPAKTVWVLVLVDLLEGSPVCLFCSFLFDKAPPSDIPLLLAPSSESASWSAVDPDSDDDKATPMTITMAYRVERGGKLCEDEVYAWAAIKAGTILRQSECLKASLMDYNSTGEC